MESDSRAGKPSERGKRSKRRTRSSAEEEKRVCLETNVKRDEQDRMWASYVRFNAASHDIVSKIEHSYRTEQAPML